MKSILDPSFRYRASFETDLHKTFERVRRAQRHQLRQASQSNPGASSNVSPIARLSDRTAPAPARIAQRR